MLLNRSAFATSDSFANSNIVGNGEEGLLIDFGDTPLVDPATVAIQPIQCHPNKLDLLFDDFEIPKLSPCPVTLPESPVASSTTIVPEARQSSTVGFSTTIPSQRQHPFFTPTDLAVTEVASYRPRTRAARAVEPHTVTKPNWALAPSIQRPIFTKEPRPVDFKAKSLPPMHTPPPSQALSGLNIVTNGFTSTNDRSTAPLEKPIVAPSPHETTKTSLSKPSIHPSRLQLLQGSGPLSDAGFGPLETKEHPSKGIPNEQITGANTVPVARVRKWGAGASQDAETRTAASGDVGEVGGMGSRLSWVDEGPSSHSSATLDAVPMGSKSFASPQSVFQSETLPPPFKRQTCSVVVESDGESAADHPTISPSRQIMHIDKSSGQNTNDDTVCIPILSPSAPSLARPSALRQRAMAEHSYAQSNPFIDPDISQAPVSTAKRRPPLLQRMGIGSRVGPSALAARRNLIIEEDGRTYDYVSQCADEETYEGYEEKEHWTPPRAGAKKVVIAEPVGREGWDEYTPPMRTPTKRVIRIAEPGPPSQVQTRRRRVIHYQEGEQDEENEYVPAYGQYQEEDLHIGSAASRRTPVSQAERDPLPRVFARTQLDPPRHVAGSRTRRVVIQAPLEADDVDEGIERFRGLSVAGRVQTPGPRRHRVVKVQ